MCDDDEKAGEKAGFFYQQLGCMPELRRKFLKAM
jgi:hypothetical protein